MSSKCQLKGGAKNSLRRSSKKSSTKVRRSSKKSSTKVRRSSNKSSTKVRRSSKKVRKSSKSSSLKGGAKKRVSKRKSSKTSIKVRRSSLKGGAKKPVSRKSSKILIKRRVSRKLTKKCMIKKGGGDKITEKEYMEALKIVSSFENIIELYKIFIASDEKNLLKSYGANNTEELKAMISKHWCRNINQNEISKCVENAILFHLQDIIKNWGQKKTEWKKKCIDSQRIPTQYGLLSAVCRVGSMYLDKDFTKGTEPLFKAEVEQIIKNIRNPSPYTTLVGVNQPKSENPYSNVYEVMEEKKEPQYAQLSFTPKPTPAKDMRQNPLYEKLPNDPTYAQFNENEMRQRFNNPPTPAPRPKQNKYIIY